MRAIHSPVEPLLLGAKRIHQIVALSGRPRRHHPPPLFTTTTCHPHARCFTSVPVKDRRRQRYQDALDALLAALRQNNHVKMYFCLLDLTRGVNHLNRDFAAVVHRIPVTTFSEIIHAFDPFTISDAVDTTSGFRISHGAAIHTPLGELVSKWGVKVLYVLIVHRLILLIKSRRREARLNGLPALHALPNDYKVLIKCAGATSDIRLVRTIYRQLRPIGYVPWIHSELYAEFAKAWYLAESLYTGHDLSSVRVRPLDMHLALPRRTIRQLRWIEWNRLKLTPGSRFGQMVRRRYYAESIRMVLKLKRPLDGLMRKALPPGQVTNEDEGLICAFIKAKGRQGVIGGIAEMLRTYWGIIIRREVQRDNSVVYHIGGGITDIPRDSCIAPTEALLDAVVHGYGNAGEAKLAGDLLQYLSHRYAIPVPDHVWSALLCYARLHRSRPANQEWALAGMPNKITPRDYINEIWQTATSAPHNFNPRMQDYLELLKEQAGRDRMMIFQEWNLELLRQVKSLYTALTKQLQLAWADVVHTIGQGVPNHAIYRRFRMLQAQKHYAWHSFQYIAQRVFKHLATLKMDDTRAVQFAPTLVLELGEFLRSKVEYHIATGKVEIRLDDIEWQDTIVMAKTESDVNATVSEQEQVEAVSHEDPFAVLEREVLHVRLRRENPVQRLDIERPAFGRRPPEVAPAGQVSLYSLRRQGKGFKGYEGEPHYAAREMTISVRRARATPASLDPGQSTLSTLEQLIRMRR